MKTTLKINYQPTEWLIRKIHNGLCTAPSILLVVMLVMMSFYSYGQTKPENQTNIDAEIMREIKQVAKQHNLKIDTKQAIVEYLNGIHYQVSVPSASLSQIKKDQVDKSLDVAVIYISEPIFDGTTGAEIPKGTYLLRMVKTAEGAVSQLIQNNNVIAQGGVHPPCHKGEEASLRNTPTLSSYASNNNNSTLVCGSHCTFFVLYCQIEYSGGYCSDQYYFCGGCFGFWGH